MVLGLPEDVPTKNLLNLLGVGFRFASHINDYMVLQKEPAGAVIWGYGTPGATVTVSLASSQKTIMKKVTQVKGKATQSLFSCEYCRLLPPAGLSENQC